MHKYAQKAQHNEENVEWLEIKIVKQLVGMMIIILYTCMITVLEKLHFYLVCVVISHSRGMRSPLGKYQSLLTYYA